MRQSALFHAALADETRLRLLSLISHGEVCVCHLQAVLGTNQPKISRHLAYLRKAGLVETRRDGRWTHYRTKKQTGGFEKILSVILNHLHAQPEIKKDVRRLKGKCC